jgi:3-methyl-2-oxobutanoate hydroxymethyltransferase
MALEESGCFALVIEKVPAALTKKVAEQLNIPIIGIGAGPYADGQVLVMHDMLGITKEFNPRFLRRYADLHSIITNAVEEYISDVKSESFPNKKESY